MLFCRKLEYFVYNAESIVKVFTISEDHNLQNSWI